MDTYPLIADHGLIGDLHTAALVTTDGEIDWFCSPRFDSPSVFASLLDPERGGRFRLAPAEPGYVSKQLYFPGSAVLITRFMTPGGWGRSAISCRCRTAGGERTIIGWSGSRGWFAARCATCSSARRGSTMGGPTTCSI